MSEPPSDLSSFAGYLFFLLLLLSANFSSAETALFSLSWFDTEKLRNSRGFSGKVFRHYLSKPSEILITLLFSNLLVNTALSSISTVVVMMVADSYSFSQTKAVALATPVLTLIILIFGEISPKQLALINPIRFVKFQSFILIPLNFILFKLTKVLAVFRWLTGIILKVFFGIKDPDTGKIITSGELQSMVDISGENGVIPKQEHEMIKSIFNLPTTIVKEVIVPRIDLTAVQSDTLVRDFIKTIQESGFSRFPVYENSIDNIIGIFYIKDLLPYLKNLPEYLTVRKLMRPVYFVPETKRVNELLKDMQLRAITMAVVVDEYGGIEGLVTLEDLIEEIVGDIMDEYDIEEEPFRKLDNNNYLVQARLPISDVNQLLDVTLPEDGFETLGGLLFDLIGRIPFKNEQVSFEDLKFTVTEVRGKRIISVKVTRTLVNPEEEI